MYRPIVCQLSGGERVKLLAGYHKAPRHFIDGLKGESLLFIYICGLP